jgi:hypothetical protein
MEYTINLTDNDSASYTFADPKRLKRMYILLYDAKDKEIPFDKLKIGYIYDYLGKTLNSRRSYRTTGNWAELDYGELMEIRSSIMPAVFNFEVWWDNEPDADEYVRPYKLVLDVSEV